MIHRDEPTRSEQLTLIEDPELREERQVWRKNVLSPPGKTMRGRRRQVIEEEKTLALSMPTTEVPLETIQELSQSLTGNQPLFDQFTRHHQVRKTRGSVEAYINSYTGRNPDGTKKKQKPIAEYLPEHRKIEISKRQRKAMYIADYLQRDTFDDRNIARIRRFSLMATQYSIRNDLPLDPDAYKMAADAVVDFGHTLNDKHNIAVLDTLRDRDLGFQIIRIGTLAADEADILNKNQPLLRVVQKEQLMREEFWGGIYDFTKECFSKNRFTNHYRETGSSLQSELERIASISPPVYANLPSEPIIGEYEAKKTA